MQNIAKRALFAFRFETKYSAIILSVSPHSSCQSAQLTLLTWMKSNLWCDCRSARCIELPCSVFNCSVCSLTELNYFYYYKKIKNDGGGRWASDIPVLRINIGITANTVYRSKPNNHPFLFSSKTCDAVLNSLSLSLLLMIFASFSGSFECFHTADMFAAL